MDPIARAALQIRQIGSAAPRIRGRVVGEVQREILARFARGEAPVQTGQLRDSLKVSVEGDDIAIRSPLPYAQRHPEAVPPEADLRRIIDRAARKELP